MDNTFWGVLQALHLFSILHKWNAWYYINGWKRAALMCLFSAMNVLCLSICNCLLCYTKMTNRTVFNFFISKVVHKNNLDLITNHYLALPDTFLYAEHVYQISQRIFTTTSFETDTFFATTISMSVTNMSNKWNHQQSLRDWMIMKYFYIFYY